MARAKPAGGTVRRKRAPYLLRRPSRRRSPGGIILPLLAGAVLGGLTVWLVSSVRRAAFEPRAIDPLRAAPTDFDWRQHPPPQFPLPPYARFLEGVKIVLDPGHGGDADREGWKRGPTGLREAEVNLRVALFLRDFLVAAGAEVVLTREADVCLAPNDAADLSARIALANRTRADLFLSIHHNAASNAQANYTSIFYHGRPDENPASVDAGRHLLSGLNDALRLEQHLGCALVSDYEIYPGEGFRVLREAEVPAVLSEASFHSHPDEEQRLRNPVYNRREAYGLFLGLARWAQAGLPRVRLREPADGRVRAGRDLVIEVDDGLRKRGGLGTNRAPVLADTLIVRFNDKPVACAADLEDGRLRIRPTPDMVQKGGTLYVNFANVFGQHVLHPQITLRPAGAD